MNNLKAKKQIFTDDPFEATFTKIQGISDQLGKLLRGTLLDGLADDRVKLMLKNMKKEIDGLKDTLDEDIDKMKERVDEVFGLAPTPTAGGPSMSS